MLSQSFPTFPRHITHRTQSYWCGRLESAQDETASAGLADGSNLDLPCPCSATRGHLRIDPNPIHLHSTWGISCARVWKLCTGGQTQKGNYWVGEQSAPGITEVIQVTCNSSHSSKWCYPQCHFQFQDCVSPQLLEMFQLFDNFLIFTLCSLYFLLSRPLFLLSLLFILFLLLLSPSLFFSLSVSACFSLSLDFLIVRQYIWINPGLIIYLWLFLSYFLSPLSLCSLWNVLNIISHLC